MRKDSKTTSNSTKGFRRLSLTTIVLATAIIAIGAITVISRQNARVEKPGETERRSPVVTNNANDAGKKFVTVEVAGQKVQVDGQTGQIKELTPEEAQKLAAGLKQLINKSTEGRDEIHHADGSVSIDLDGRFQNVTVAKVDEDGNLTQSCVDNPKAAGAFFGIDAKQIENAEPKDPTKVLINKTQN